MEFPWLPLSFILTLLGVTLFICSTLNASEGALRWNGALIFLVLCCAAMLLDFTLTMIFASAGFAERTRYDSYGSRIAWSERILTYLIPCVISMLLALRFRRRQHSAREPGRLGNDAARENPAEIQTFRRTRAKLRI